MHYIVAEKEFRHIGLPFHLLFMVHHLLAAQNHHMQVAFKRVHNLIMTKMPLPLPLPVLPPIMIKLVPQAWPHLPQVLPMTIRYILVFLEL